MTQARSRVWVEVLAVIVTLAVGGLLLYTLLPLMTTPGQQVVPPPSPMDVQQTLLTLFIVATAIGAPVTVGIILWLVARPVSKRVPASSSVAPEIPSIQPKAHTGGPKEMSSREATTWKIVATVLLLIIGAGTLALLASVFTQFYH